MQDEITKAMGIPDLPPQVFERTRKAILTDNFLYNKILWHLILGAAANVIVNLHPIEREHLRKRTGFAAQERGTATWGIVENYENGKISLKAECAACKQDAIFTAPQ